MQREHCALRIGQLRDARASGDLFPCAVLIIMSQEHPFEIKFHLAAAPFFITGGSTESM
jgi:hypothetical protein